MTRLEVGSCGLVAIVLACAPGSGDTEATTSSGGSESTDTGGTEGTGPLLVGEPEVIHHPNQPMVLDLRVELDAPGTGTLVHPTDDDVGVFLLEPAAGEAATSLHFRVRGLLPDAAHALALEVTEAEGTRTGSWSGDVTTDPPLPGFLPKFQVELADVGIVEEEVWRLFDMNRLFSDDPSGLFLVDHEGTTRWYLGDGDNYSDLDDIFAAANVRADGSVSFLRRDAGWIVDELGEVQMHVTAEQLGDLSGWHHELLELPSGNFLVLGYSFADVDYEGEGTLYVAGDTILEFTPAGELVWSWDSFDHLDPQRRREGFFIPTMIPDAEGTPGHDWTHGNGLEYDAQTDVILFSMRHQDWISAIDHGTGEILWNLGPDGDFTLVGDDTWFFHQHSPQWQPDGSLLLYDNAVGNPELDDVDTHARAVRYTLDLDTMEATLVWADDDPRFVAPVAGDADRMPGGHVLRLDSSWVNPELGEWQTRVRELDPELSPNAIWTLYLPPGKFGYRARPVDHWVGTPAP